MFHVVKSINFGPFWFAVIVSDFIKQRKHGSTFYYLKLARFPFDAKTPIGFSAAIAILYVLTSNIVVIVKTFLLIGIATMPMLFSLTDDIQCDLSTIKRSLGHRRKRLKITENLSQFVQFHSDTKQLGWQHQYNETLDIYITCWITNTSYNVRCDMESSLH